MNTDMEVEETNLFGSSLLHKLVRGTDQDK
jgi:hypothetical protein